MVGYIDISIYPITSSQSTICNYYYISEKYAIESKLQNADPIK